MFLIKRGLVGGCRTEWGGVCLFSTCMFNLFLEEIISIAQETPTLFNIEVRSIIEVWIGESNNVLESKTLKWFGHASRETHWPNIYPSRKYCEGIREERDRQDMPAEKHIGQIHLYPSRKYCGGIREERDLQDMSTEKHIGQIYILQGGSVRDQGRMGCPGHVNR